MAGACSIYMYGSYEGWGWSPLRQCEESLDAPDPHGGSPQAAPQTRKVLWALRCRSQGSCGDHFFESAHPNSDARENEFLSWIFLSSKYLLIFYVSLYDFFQILTSRYFLFSNLTIVTFLFESISIFSKQCLSASLPPTRSAWFSHSGGQDDLWSQGPNDCGKSTLLKAINNEQVRSTETFGRSVEHEVWWSWSNPNVGYYISGFVGCFYLIC